MKADRDDFRMMCINHLVAEYIANGDESDLGGWDKKRKMHYPHILKDQGLIRKMLIGRAKSFDESEPGFSYHSDAHHLNSSQMFCINMFQPLRKSRKDVLRSLLGVWGVPLKGTITKTCFEKVGCQMEKTHFDFYAETDLAERVFFEIKYTERNFAEDPDGRRDEYYRDWLDYSLYLKGLPLSEFYSHYQIYRNISYIRSPSDYVVFLYPYESKSLVDDVAQVGGLSAMANVRMANSANAFVDVDCALAELNDKGSPLLGHYRDLVKWYFGWRCAVREGLVRRVKADGKSNVAK